MLLQSIDDETQRPDIQLLLLSSFSLQKKHPRIIKLPMLKRLQQLAGHNGPRGPPTC